MDNYRNVKAINYSLLSTLDTDPSLLLEDKVVTAAMEKGTMIDKLLFEKETFFKEYYIIDFEKPGDSLKKLIEEIFNKVKNKDNPNLENETELISQTAKTLEYQPRWKPETLVKKVIEDGKEYFDKLKQTEGYILIEQEDYQKAATCVEIIKNNKWTRGLVISSSDDIEIKYQYPIYWEMNGYRCKALLDIVLFNHREKIILPLDLKTTSQNTYREFQSSVIKFKYYLQAAWYTIGLENLYGDKYQILGFQNIPVNVKRTKLLPLYTYSPRDISFATNGGYLNGRYRKGALQLANEVEWHTKNNKWDYPKEVYDNNGIVTSELFDNEHNVS